MSTRGRRRAAAILLGSITSRTLSTTHLPLLAIKHYSARTIVHVLRHHSAVAEVDGEGWKINDHHSPYFARLFDLVHPEHVGLWEFRETKKAGAPRASFAARAAA